MMRANINDLHAFVTIAHEKSFTRAAVKLGMSQSGLSHAIRGLERRLGVRLLTRTTRSLSPTEAGAKLLSTVAPCFDDIEAELQVFGDMRHRPSGTIRITATDYVIRHVLWDRVAVLLKDYPDVVVELEADYGLRDIVAEGFDAGVRLGQHVGDDMVAVRISPDIRFVVVAAPSYFESAERPKVPEDINNHRCVNLRLPTPSALWTWEFEKHGRAVRIQALGQCVFNSIFAVCDAALMGMGLAYMPEQLARPYIEKGELCTALDDWCHYRAGHHLYYPNRKHMSAAMTTVVEALRV
jgi:DNA-binding transcriptional LysR family regulator